MVPVYLECMPLNTILDLIFAMDLFISICRSFFVIIYFPISSRMFIFILLVYINLLYWYASIGWQFSQCVVIVCNGCSFKLGPVCISWFSVGGLPKYVCNALSTSSTLHQHYITHGVIPDSVIGGSCVIAFNLTCLWLFWNCPLSAKFAIPTHWHACYLVWLGAGPLTAFDICKYYVWYCKFY